MFPVAAENAGDPAVQLLLAEAGQAVLGWAYLTIADIVIETQADLELYHQALDVFEEVVAGREHRCHNADTYVTFAVRGQSFAGQLRAEDADWVIAELQDRLYQRISPSFLPSGWEIHASAA